MCRGYTKNYYCERCDDFMRSQFKPTEECERYSRKIQSQPEFVCDNNVEEKVKKVRKPPEEGCEACLGPVNGSSGKQKSKSRHRKDGHADAGYYPAEAQETPRLTEYESDLSSQGYTYDDIISIRPPVNDVEEDLLRQGYVYDDIYIIRQDEFSFDQQPQYKNSKGSYEGFEYYEEYGDGPNGGYRRGGARRYFG